jgi:hypothetical protein
MAAKIGFQKIVVIKQSCDVQYIINSIIVL